MYLQPTNVKIRIANPDGDGTIEVDHPALMPVDLVQEIWDTGPALFQRSMVGPRGGQTVKDFWSATRDSDWVKSHPHLQHDDLSTTIPLWIHGDMARVYKVQKLLILSWMSSLVSGCSWNSRHIFTVIPHDVIAKGVTLQDLLKHYATAINDLQKGKRADGSPLAGQFRFAYAGSKGSSPGNLSLVRFPGFNWGHLAQ
jgi:hypothetical protein